MKANLKQRLSRTTLQAWERAGLGMFLHFGMSTYDGEEFSHGTLSANCYRPVNLDVGQWVGTAKAMRASYAILTAKHVSGFCLWPSRHTDYHVGNSEFPEDVVGRFVEECRAQGVKPGLYYCSWDNHHLFGSKTPLHTGFDLSYTTGEYRDFQTAQIEELLTRYGDLFEVWIDIPKFLPRDFRDFLYNRIAELQPQAVIVANAGYKHGGDYPVYEAWPSDIFTFERMLPPGPSVYDPVHEVEGSRYYLPAEVCDTMGKEWFYHAEDSPRSVAYLLGLYLSARARGANLLLDVGPSPDGLIDDRFTGAAELLGNRIADKDLCFHEFSSD